MNDLSNSSTCLLLTATIKVKDDVFFTTRKDADQRLEDYKQSLSFWIAQPGVDSIVFVENSASDLSALMEVAKRVSNKHVEFLSFAAPDFDGALGKGYGEMLCLEHVVRNSKTLAKARQFVKITGRYCLANASEFLAFAKDHPDAIICDMLENLTWADSRIFAAPTEFLRSFLLPMLDQLDDSRGSYFEHVLARAVHHSLYSRGTWIEPPFPLFVQGVSGSMGLAWEDGIRKRMKLHLRHYLFSRLLRGRLLK